MYIFDLENVKAYLNVWCDMELHCTRLELDFDNDTLHVDII